MMFSNNNDWSTQRQRYIAWMLAKTMYVAHTFYVLFTQKHVQRWQQWLG